MKKTLNRSTFRFGCCLNMVAQTSDGVGTEAIPVLAENGYEFIELSLAHLTVLEGARRQEVLSRIHDSPIPCETCNNFFPASYRLTGEQADHEAALRHAERAVTLAASLGAEVIVFGSSGARNVPKGFPVEQAWDQLQEFVNRMIPLLEEHRIRIAVEHLNRGESNIMTSFLEVVRFVREINSPQVQSLFDVYHLDLEKESPEVILRGAGLIAHVHTADVTARSWPTWPSQIMESVFRLLRKIGYAGRISVEAATSDLPGDSRAALGYLRSLQDG